MHVILVPITHCATTNTVHQIEDLVVNEDILGDDADFNIMLRQGSQL